MVCERYLNGLARLDHLWLKCAVAHEDLAFPANCKKGNPEIFSTTKEGIYDSSVYRHAP